jgi:hypothetical protein
MSGVKLPVGLVGTSAVVGSHIAKGTLPFTGMALGIYLAVGGGLVLTGLVLRLIARAN